ncbi:MAG: AMP-binding domain-containing protein [Deltaproteobacteria bacterium]|nr:AMP-binding domain-containing protein [Deltaproteobacteria bacterium]
MSMPNEQRARDRHERHVGGLFFQRAAELGDRTFVKLRRSDRFEEISWADFRAKVRSAIFGLYGLGLKKGNMVAIIGENSLEWLCADMATLAGGFPNVTIAPSLSDGMTLKVLNHSRCRAAFVENEAAAGKLLNLKGQLPALAHIIVMDGTAAHLPQALTFAALLARGAGAEEHGLDAILESIHPDDLATVIYTSGSTGEPKGVMRTHGNLLSNITNGGAIVVSKPENVKSIEALAPTAMTIVPRVMEKMLQSILDQGANRERWERLAALDQTRRDAGSLSAAEEQKFSELHGALKESVKKALGGRVKYISYSGAAMPPRIMRFFELAGIPLLGTYGSTECGGVTLSGIGENKPGSAGKPFANVEVRIAEDGEILVRGPTVTPGYLDNPQATREAIDEEGWFHSGDLGNLDADGCLYVVGRKKDVFYCSDGSNIYPSRIELLLENDPFVRQAVLVGDHHPFLAALVVPDRETIAAELKKSDSALSVEEIESLLHGRVEKINASLEEVEKIRKIILLREDFPPSVRGLTTIQKVKIDRKAAAEQYAREIAAIYSLAGKGAAP